MGVGQTYQCSDVVNKVYCLVENPTAERHNNGIYVVSYTVEPQKNGHVGDEHLSIVQRLSLLWKYIEMYGRQGANSVSIAGRLSTLQSVHYQRFR